MDLYKDAKDETDLILIEKKTSQLTIIPRENHHNSGPNASLTGLQSGINEKTGVNDGSHSTTIVRQKLHIPILVSYEIFNSCLTAHWTRVHSPIPVPHQQPTP